MTLHEVNRYQRRSIFDGIAVLAENEAAAANVDAVAAAVACEHEHTHSGLVCACGEPEQAECWRQIAGSSMYGHRSNEPFESEYRCRCGRVDALDERTVCCECGEVTP